MAAEGCQLNLSSLFCASAKGGTPPGRQERFPLVWSQDLPQLLPLHRDAQMQPSLAAASFFRRLNGWMSLCAKNNRMLS
eukprot:23475_6